MMGKVIMSGIVPPLVAPVTGIALADIAEGSIVKLNESGSPVEFYVAKHNYESALNGVGKTLLARKDCVAKMAWNASGVNTYNNSTVDVYLNGTYKALLDKVAQENITATQIYYTPGNGTNSGSTIGKEVFLLSAWELGMYGSSNNEGTTLATADILRNAYFDGAGVAQFTRSPDTSRTTHVCIAWYNGPSGSAPCKDSYGVRPCFTLPATALFDEETLLFKGVS